MAAERVCTTRTRAARVEQLRPQGDHLVALGERAAQGDLRLPQARHLHRHGDDAAALDLPHHRPLAAVMQGGGRQQRDRGGTGAQPHGAGHAERGPARRLRQGEAHGIGAQRRVGLRRDLTQMGRERLPGAGPQQRLGARIGEVGQGALGHLHQQFALRRVGHAHHHLAFADHLAGLGENGGDDAIGRRAQDGVVEPVAGKFQRGAGGGDAFLGTARRGLALFVEGGGDMAGSEQGARAGGIGQRPACLGLGGGKVGLGATDRQGDVGRVDAGEVLPGRHGGADIDQPGGDAAAGAEGDVGLAPGADHAGEGAWLLGRGEVDLGDLDGLRRFRHGGLGGGVTARCEQNEGCKGGQGDAHGGSPGMIQDIQIE